MKQPSYPQVLHPALPLRIAYPGYVAVVGGFETPTSISWYSCAPFLLFLLALFPGRHGHFDFLRPWRPLDIADQKCDGVPDQSDDGRARRAPDIDAHASVRTPGEAEDPFDVPGEPSPRVREDGRLCMPELQREPEPAGTRPPDRRRFGVE